MALLAAAYSRAELSVVYPVARGLAPVIVLLAGIAALGVGTSAGEMAGVALVGAGVLLVRGLGQSTSSGLAYGFAIAACIAGYTLADARGIEHADPLAYVVVVLAPSSAAYLALVWWRGGRKRLGAALGWAPVLIGLASFGAFALVLAALQRASAASVAAVRESSVVIAVLLAAPLLGEEVGRRRVAGAFLVFAGVAILAVS